MSNTSSDLQWIQSLPKISLHDHLDGGLQIDTLLDLAQQAKWQLPAQTASALTAWFSPLGQAETGQRPSLEAYLQKFRHTLALMQEPYQLRRVAYEHVLALAADGVVYAEVRWAPQLHRQAGLTMEEAVRAVADGLHDGMDRVSQAGRPIMVQQILCAMRQQTDSLAVAELALACRKLGVVGFDLAGPEQGYPASNHQPALDYLAQHFMPVTLHVGEGTGLDSIQDALLAGHPLRLGHGISLLKDVTLEPNRQDKTGQGPASIRLGLLATWIKDRRITLELCPQSNLHTGAAPRWSKGKLDFSRPASQLREYPIEIMRQAGFSITVNPDNRLMSSTSLSKEFALLAQNFNYGPAEFFELTVNALEGAFIPLEQKGALLSSLEQTYLQLIEQQTSEKGS